MKETTRILAFIVWIALWFMVGFGLGWKARKTVPEPQVIRDTVTCTILDTFVVQRPVYRYSYVHDTVRTYFSTIEHDTVTVDVPMERRVYEEDSLYRAVVSGWRPSLDSLTIFPKTTTISILETVVKPAPRWSLGVTAGPSALVTPGGRVHAGLGCTVGVHYSF